MANRPADLYGVLGIKRDASAEEIRKAYRALAKKHHPDLNPGDKTSEQEFHRIQNAYDILADEEKRKRYDAGEIDAEGNESARSFYREYANAESGHPYRSTAGFEDIGDIFGDLFGRRGFGRGAGEHVDIRMQGGDLRYTMDIDFIEAAAGGKRRVTMPDGRTLDIAIPPGQRDGQILRLRGQGLPGIGGGEPGDAYIETRVRPHPQFRRQGDDILLDLPVALHEAVLGARVQVPTISGAVTMTIPAGSNTGDTLRLRGRGVRRQGAGGSGAKGAGDQLVTLRVVLPDEPDDELRKFMETWSGTHAYDPRKNRET